MSINTEIYMGLVAEHQKIIDGANSKDLKQDYEFIIRYEDELLKKIKTEEIRINQSSRLREQLVQRDKEEIEKSLIEKRDLLDLLTLSIGDTHLKRIKRLNYDEEVKKAINRATIADRYLTYEDIKKILK